MSYKILIVEDNEDIIKVLKLYLEGEGYDIDTANNGIDGLDLIKHSKIDLAIVDIMMPKMDGYQLISEARKVSNLPIIVISAKDDDNDKILGLNIGADDYITKPFNPLEIVARVKSNLRRHNKLSNNSSKNGELELGDLKLNTNSCVLTKGDNEVQLTATEYKILALLMNNPQQIFSKVQISEHISGDYFQSQDKVITVHISHLRDKIGKNIEGNQYIKTIKGLGYKIENK